MASPDTRPAFRLPWQSAQQSESEPEAAAGTAVAEPPVWPSHDLARRQTRTTEPAPGAEPAPNAEPPLTDPTPNPAGSADDATDGMADGMASAGAVLQPGTEPAGATGVAPSPTQETASVATGEAVVDRSVPMTETALEPLRELAAGLRGRKPTKFLADLTRAMRQAADEARQGAMAQFQADVERHTDAARATCDAAAGQARQRADDDITALGEWETTEIARIRRETEEGTTARHERLESELADQAIRLDEELARVHQRVEAFGAEMETFFEGLLHEDDPAHFASMAEQLPEPPTFDAWSAEAMTWTPDSAIAESTDDSASAVDMAPGGGPQHDDAGMPPMRAGDFAAAEAEAADWVAIDADAAGALDATNPTESEPAPAGGADGDTDQGAPWPPAALPASAAPAASRTQAAVVGLVSVASIATFKRLLGRVPGVRSVQVSSGPAGEFLFTATHDEHLDMAAAVAGIQGFEVEVVESGPGIVTARAVDPEIV